MPASLLNIDSRTQAYYKDLAVENFIEIVTQPDNIAIVIMLLVVAVCTVHSIREMRINDRFIKEGKKAEIYRRMIRP